MKKLIIPILAVAALSFASCRKDRTCTCNETVSVAGQSTTGTSKNTVSKANKRVAKNVTGCYSYKQSETVNSVAVETTRECELD